MCSTMTPANKAKALLIGISNDGQGNPLRGPKKDVLRMRKLLMNTYGYREDDIVAMHDKQRVQHLRPTRENILREMDNLVKDCRPGDRFVFHYSGHTGQQDNLDGSEVDGKDERIETETGWILDDEIRIRLVDPLCPGSQLIAILDSCHSATLLDLPHVECHLRLVPILQPAKPKGSASHIINSDITSHRYPPPLSPSLATPVTIKQQGFGPFRGRGRLPSLKQSLKRNKKPKLTLPIPLPKFPSSAFTASGPITSILPPDTSYVLSPVVGPASPVRPPSRRCSGAHMELAPKVEFYDGECEDCPLPPKDQMKRKNSELPMVLAIAACKDSQFSYEDQKGSGMTMALYGLLNKTPNPTLNRLYTGICFSMFNPAYERVRTQSWADFVNDLREKGAVDVPNSYQSPSLSSLQRLNPNWKFTL